MGGRSYPTIVADNGAADRGPAPPLAGPNPPTWPALSTIAARRAAEPWHRARRGGAPACRRGAAWRVRPAARHKQTASRHWRADCRGRSPAPLYARHGRPQDDRGRPDRRGLLGGTCAPPRPSARPAGKGTGPPVAVAARPGDGAGARTARARDRADADPGRAGL